MDYVNFASTIAAECSTQHLFKHGAVIIKGKEIIGVGYNTQVHHAESKAIQDAIWRVLQD